VAVTEEKITLDNQ